VWSGLNWLRIKTVAGSCKCRDKLSGSSAMMLVINTLPTLVLNLLVLFFLVTFTHLANYSEFLYRTTCFDQCGHHQVRFANYIYATEHERQHLHEMCAVAGV
jgi:hypothetical protein